MSDSLQADSKPTLNVTPLAAEKIAEFAKADGKDGWALKITAKDNDGFEPLYEMDFQETANEKSGESGEKLHKISGVKIILDQESTANLEHAQVDFMETPYGSGFKINNPNFLSLGDACGGSCEGCTGCG
jgi:iron-sulfur cluster assembly accessory protein